MRIAILGSSITPIPPVGQASVETLAYQQTLGLADRGHEVTLYAQAGSSIPNPKVTVVGIGDVADTASGSALTPEEVYGSAYRGRLRFARMAELLILLRRKQKDCDVALNNLCEESPVLAADTLLRVPIYHVLHVPVTPPTARIFANSRAKLISISNAQRKAFPDLNYAGTVYNGVDTSVFTFSPTGSDYVLYLGSISKNKNPRDAILAAKLAGVAILIGGKLKDKAYYEKEIAPLIDGKTVRWIGELNQAEVVKLYQGAQAFLFPTLWSEPFGLVAIEALSCGTPVIAYPNGGLTEIVVDAVNGYLVNNVEEMAKKIHELNKIDRHACRLSAEKNFSIENMITGYEHVLMSAKLL